MSKNTKSEKPWIGVDLDGTLAYYDGWKGEDNIGEPIPAMLTRVKGWLGKGKRVKIITARAGVMSQIPYVRAWLDKYGLGTCEITNIKDFLMLEIWDDRAVQVVPNTGKRVDGKE